MPFALGTRLGALMNVPFSTLSVRLGGGWWGEAHGGLMRSERQEAELRLLVPVGSTHDSPGPPARAQEAPAVRVGQSLPCIYFPALLQPGWTQGSLQPAASGLRGGVPTAIPP